MRHYDKEATDFDKISGKTRKNPRFNIPFYVLRYKANKRFIRYMEGETR